MRVGVLGCGKAKLSTPAPVRELYCSVHFKAALAWLEARCSRVYVASALHGLLDLDQIVEPYDLRLTSETKMARRRWGLSVARDLCARIDLSDTVVFVMGRSYWEAIATGLAARGVKFAVPFEHDKLARRTLRISQGG